MKQGRTDIQEKFSIAGGQQVDEISTDNTLGGNSNTAIPTEKAVKEYVDSLSLGLDWQESVKDQIDFTSAEPGSPSVGDRYINTATGTSSVTTQSVTANYIYEWNGSSWDETITSEGMATWVEDEDILYVFNVSWAKFGSTVTHANLNGLQGGQASEYYHLKSAEHSELTNWLDNVTLGSDGTFTLPNGVGINEFSSDGTLGGDSDLAVPTEKAVKTYVDANAGGGLSNVLFQWNGCDDGTPGTTLPAYGLTVNNNTLNTTPVQPRYAYIWCNSGTNTCLRSKFKKTSGITTATVWMRMWSAGGGGANAKGKIVIGSASIEVGAVSGTTPTWYSNTINLSGLSDGTTYDLEVQMRSTSFNVDTCCSAIMIIAD